MNNTIFEKTTIDKIIESEEFARTLSQMADDLYDADEAFYDCCGKITENLLAELEDEELSDERRRGVADDLVETVRLISRHEASDKHFAAGVLTAAGALALILGFWALKKKIPYAGASVGR